MSRLHLLAVWGMFVLTVPAKAEPVWKYTWLLADGIVETQTGGVAIATTPQGIHEGTTAEIVAANLSLFRSFAAPEPEIISDGEYLLRLALEDMASGDQGELSFRGRISGSFTTTEVQLSNQFLDGAKSIPLGNWVYTVELNLFEPPGPMTSAHPGHLGATIQVQPRNTTPNTTPEPTTMTLLGLGLPVVVLATRRRTSR